MEVTRPAFHLLKCSYVKYVKYVKYLIHPNTYVMWCHVCHVIWNNDFWRLGVFGVKPPIVWMANEVSTWFGTRTACWVCAVCEPVSSGWFNWQAVAIPRKKGVCAWGWMHVRYVRSATECFFFGTCSGLETVEMDLGSMQWGSKSWWSIRNQISACSSHFWTAFPGGLPVLWVSHEYWIK